MADIPTMYQKRSPELTIVSADIKDGDYGNIEVKKLPMSSGVSWGVSEAGELAKIKKVLYIYLPHCS